MKMVDTMEDAKTRRKRTHSAELKAEVLAACAEPGASVAAIALSRGLNTNLVHKWRRQAARAAETVASRSASAMLPVPPGSEFVALPLPGAAALQIRVEIRRGATSVVVSWPASAAGECAAWLGTWLR
jgi:transposase